MKNIYNITKSQLVTIWIFSLLGWLWAMDNLGPWGSNFAGFFVWFLPFANAFYTLGWRNHNVDNSQK